MSEDKSIVVYRDVPDFPGYVAGTDGSVWSERNNAGKVSGEWKRLRPLISRKGYLLVTLRRNAKSFLMSIHKIVLLSFVGPRPDGMQCRHYPDRDPANNAIVNIAWGTRQQNEQDKADHQRLLLSRPVGRDKATGRFITRDDELSRAQQFGRELSPSPTRS